MGVRDVVGVASVWVSETLLECPPSVANPESAGEHSCLRQLAYSASGRREWSRRQKQALRSRLCAAGSARPPAAAASRPHARARSLAQGPALFAGVFASEGEQWRPRACLVRQGAPRTCTTCISAARLGARFKGACAAQETRAACSP